MWKFHVTMSRKTGEVYMHRWQPLKTRLLSIYINKICLPDEDDWMHTHPWRKSWSLKLRGYYWELRGPNNLLCNPPRWSRIPDQHRIVATRRGEPCWTLFIGWRSELPWGFVNPATGEVVPWRERAKQRGLDESAFSGAQNSR